jgi:hypothetical protein
MKPRASLSPLSRVQVGTGILLPASEKCGLCDRKAVAEIAGVSICRLHKRRVEAIAAENAGTSGRHPQVWQIAYKVAS